MTQTIDVRIPAGCVHLDGLIAADRNAMHSAAIRLPPLINRATTECLASLGCKARFQLSDSFTITDGAVVFTLVITSERGGTSADLDAITDGIYRRLRLPLRSQLNTVAASASPSPPVDSSVGAAVKPAGCELASAAADGPMPLTPPTDASKADLMPVLPSAFLVVQEREKWSRVLVESCTAAWLVYLSDKSLPPVVVLGDQHIEPGMDLTVPLLEAEQRRGGLLRLSEYRFEGEDEGE